MQSKTPGPHAADVDNSGAHFGGYVLLRHLGRGGMAEVDLARVESPGGVEKLVVVKRIRHELSNNATYVRMFLDEARIATALQHPNIIQVHDVGEIGGQPFIAMEYLRGKDLSKVLIAATERRCHLPLDFSVGTICGVCEGLHHAHQMRNWEGEPLSIVHRDVSPDNVFISYEGHIKLMDFGLAKAKNRSTKTRVGIVKGTVGYMAPEQLKAADIDRRLDVFAAGVVLWELVTGNRLFESSTTREAWEELHRKAIPSPSKLRPECSVALEAIIRRALHKDPEQRYQSAQAMLLDLERMAAQQHLWLSANRRAEVMDALFPGRRDRALHDMTKVSRNPTPLALSSISAPTGWRLVWHGIVNWARKKPETMLATLGVLLLVLLGMTLALWLTTAGTSSPTRGPATMSRDHASSTAADAVKKAKKSSKAKKPTRRKKTERKR